MIATFQKFTMKLILGLMWLKISFPSSETIEQVLDDIKDVEPTLVINYKTSSKSDILKYQFCQEFVKVKKCRANKKIGYTKQ